MGLIASWWAVLLLPAALLIAFGFAAVGMAATSYMKSVPGPRPGAGRACCRCSCSAARSTAWPSTRAGCSIVVECLPLQHGIELMRDLNAGVVSWGLLGHAAYFVVMAAVGLVVTARRLDRLLLR